MYLSNCLGAQQFDEDSLYFVPFVLCVNMTHCSYTAYGREAAWTRKLQVLSQSSTSFSGSHGI